MGLTTVGELLDYLNTQPRDRLVVTEDRRGQPYPFAHAREAMYVRGGEIWPTLEEIAAMDNPDSYRPAPANAVRVVLLGLDY